MAHLANVLGSSDAINDESFLAYKDRVIGYLTGFASEFRRAAQKQRAPPLVSDPESHGAAAIAAPKDRRQQTVGGLAEPAVEDSGVAGRCRLRSSSAKASRWPVRLRIALKPLSRTTGSRVSTESDHPRREA